MNPRDADMAQLVEHHLAKVGVAGSNPVVRSIVNHRPVDTNLSVGLFDESIGRDGQVVRQRPAKPLSPVRIRFSPPTNLTPFIRTAFCIFSVVFLAD